MAFMWLMTIGFAVCLGMTGGVFIYYLKGALNSDDSNRIDPLPTDSTE